MMISLIIITLLVIGLVYILLELKKLKKDKEVLLEELEHQTNEQSLFLSLFDKGDATLFKWKNDEHWSIENVSLSVKLLLGYDKEDFMSEQITYASCIHKEDLDKVSSEVIDASESGIEFFKHEPYRIITKDGAVKWVLDYTTVVRNKHGVITHYIGVISDITDIKQKDKKLIEQSRLAQMGEMVSMIAHQWRQPLGAISSTAINLKMKIELDSFSLNTVEDKEYCFSYFYKELNNIESFTQSLTQTIDDFRDFYKPNRIIKSVSVDGTVLKAINIIKNSLFSNHIELIEKYNSNKKLEMFDNEIMQVILSIFKNSVDNFKYTKSDDAKVWIKTEDTFSGVLISICDNGGGISEDIIKKIFDPYFSTKHDKNGTGLGLYMSKIIIADHHGGAIYAVNENDGVCFYIELLDSL